MLKLAIVSVKSMEKLETKNKGLGFIQVYGNNMLYGGVMLS
jgi:hypothetical protein